MTHSAVRWGSWLGIFLQHVLMRNVTHWLNLVQLQKCSTSGLLNLCLPSFGTFTLLVQCVITQLCSIGGFVYDSDFHY